MNLNKRVAQALIISILFLVLVPLTAHLLFSSLGYNPTDDGFILAYSRRIVEGQIPHRDFISIRPFLSPLLHIPFVLWGGDHTYLISRLFVWFQLACIAWIWISLIEKRIVGQFFGNLEKVFIALISFAVSVHTFPILAWHTIDGLFLISIGLALCMTKKPANKIFGYFLMGLAYLCKQSFIFVAPLTLIIIGDWRKKKYWSAILAPGIFYVAFLLLTNALPDAILQLTSHENILSAVLQTYFKWAMFLGIFVGYLATFLVISSSQIKLPLNKIYKEWLGLFTLSLIPLIGISLAFVSVRFILHSSLGLFGMVVGVIGCLLLKKVEKIVEQVRIALLVLIMAWSVSLSIGYNFPVLASGQLLAVLLAFTYPMILQKLEKLKGSHIYTIVLLALATIVLVSFGIARMHYIYRDQAASNLTKRLDGVLPGGKGIKTNQNTYNFLTDLQEAIRVSQKLAATYSIIPDCAGWWVKSPQENPLCIDWVQGTELHDEKLFRRVCQELESMRNTNIVIVQKVKANTLANGFIPLISNRYAVVEYVRNQFTKVYESELFELFK